MIQNANRKLIFYFDQECSFCLKTVKVLKVFDFFSNIEFIGIQSLDDKDAELIGFETNEMLIDIYSIDKHGNTYKGIYTYRKCFSYIPFLYPFAILLKIPGIFHLGDMIYKRISSKRHCRV